jgi:hypothetical protein
MLNKTEDWNLPFNVFGYFDLRHHEPVPEAELTDGINA